MTPSSPDTSPCTCAMLRKAARRMTQHYDHALRITGLRLTQYSVLANLARHSGLNITELAERLAMDRSTLTRNLGPLEKAGWVDIDAGPDRRQRSVCLTDAGRAIFEQAQPQWQQTERAFRDAFGREQAAELRALLGQVMDAPATDAAAR